jgi:hypothetical protein
VRPDSCFPSPRLLRAWPVLLVLSTYEMRFLRHRCHTIQKQKQASHTLRRAQLHGLLSRAGVLCRSGLHSRAYVWPDPGSQWQLTPVEQHQHRQNRQPSAAPNTNNTNGALGLRCLPDSHWARRRTKFKRTAANKDFPAPEDRGRRRQPISRHQSLIADVRFSSLTYVGHFPRGKIHPLFRSGRPRCLGYAGVRFRRRARVGEGDVEALEEEGEITTGCVIGQFVKRTVIVRSSRVLSL